MKRTPLKRKTPMKRVGFKILSDKQRLAPYSHPPSKFKGYVSPKPRKRMRQASPKRATELALYRKEAKAFIAAHLADPVRKWCPVAMAGRLLINSSQMVRDVHHKAGRNGKLLRDQSKWLAVSRQGHEWIHAHPNEARRCGWLI